MRDNENKITAALRLIRRSVNKAHADNPSVASTINRLMTTVTYLASHVIIQMLLRGLADMVTYLRACTVSAFLASVSAST